MRWNIVFEIGGTTYERVSPSLDTREMMGLVGDIMDWNTNDIRLGQIRDETTDSTSMGGIRYRGELVGVWRATLDRPFQVLAGKYEDDGELNTKHSSSWATLDEALTCLAAVNDYPWSCIEYDGWHLEGVIV